MTCLSCKHFCVWNGDPVCTCEFKISLPKEPCEKFDECSYKLAQLHVDMWNNSKEMFFKDNILSPELKEEYLSLFPKDVILL